MGSKKITKAEFDSLISKDLKPDGIETEISPGGVYVHESWHISGMSGVRRVSLQGADGHLYYRVNTSWLSLINPINYIRYLFR